MENLINSPTFSELKKPLKQAIGRRNIITYNAEFDERLYRQSRKSGRGFVPKGVWHCAMREYAQFLGEWDDYHQHYKWHKLEGGDHSAVGDCLATLSIIKRMAQARKLKKWYEFWVGD
jgi:DNA polymerase-3 subunit epsilon